MQSYTLIHRKDIETEGVNVFEDGTEMIWLVKFFDMSNTSYEDGLILSCRT